MGAAPPVVSRTKARALWQKTSRGKIMCKQPCAGSACPCPCPCLLSPGLLHPPGCPAGAPARTRAPAAHGGPCQQQLGARQQEAGGCPPGAHATRCQAVPHRSPPCAHTTPCMAGRRACLEALALGGRPDRDAPVLFEQQEKQAVLALQPWAGQEGAGSSLAAWDACRHGQTRRQQPVQLAAWDAPAAWDTLLRPGTCSQQGRAPGTRVGSGGVSIMSPPIHENPP